MPQTDLVVTGSWAQHRRILAHKANIENAFLQLGKRQYSVPCFRLPLGGNGEEKH